ncbi:MAG: di-heme enzyme [Leptospiraceae bacterium]|nr:di-heme enzyme [Leptospiraceae bacterium]
MKTIFNLALIVSTVGLLLNCAQYNPHLTSTPGGSVWKFLPDYIPAPREFADNPVTPEKVELGRRLFYEKKLSGNGQMACAGCHIQKKAFADGLTVPAGTTGQLHPRNSMSLVNLAFVPVLTWGNPLMRRLHTQALVPIFGENPVELGLTGNENQFLEQMRSDADYLRLYKIAFPDHTDKVTMETTVLALEAFQRSLFSFNSAADKFEHGNTSALSESAKRGLNLFFSEKMECFHCHGGINFTSSIDTALHAEPEIDFSNNGLYNVDGNGAYPTGNTGIHEVTGRAADMGKFKAPTLRNIEVSAPYMHDGSIATLEAVVEHYARGGTLTPSGPKAGDGATNPFKSSFVAGFSATTQEKEDLVNYLKSLTDCDFLTNKNFSNPFPEGHANNNNSSLNQLEITHPCYENP